MIKVAIIVLLEAFSFNMHEAKKTFDINCIPPSAASNDCAANAKLTKFNKLPIMKNVIPILHS